MGEGKGFLGALVAVLTCETSSGTGAGAGSAFTFSFDGGQGFLQGFLQEESVFFQEEDVALLQDGLEG